MTSSLPQALEELLAHSMPRLEMSVSVGHRIGRRRDANRVPGKLGGSMERGHGGGGAGELKPHRLTEAVMNASS